MKALSRTGVPIRALQVLSSLYMCYETDLCLYIKTISKSNNTYSKVIKTLLNKQYIIKSNIYQKKVIAITRKGVIALCDLFPETNYQEMVTYAKQNFPTLADSTKLIPRLEENTLSLLFTSFTFNKPDLYYLYSNLSNQESYIKNNYNPSLKNDLYDNSTDQFSKGHFYTRQELFNLNKILNPTDPSINDLYFSSRFRGIYLSPKHLLVVYHASSYPSGVLKITSSAEESLCQLVTSFFSFALSLNTKADCLLVGRSPSYAYNLLIGKFGHRFTENKTAPVRAKKTQGFLNLSSGIYDKYYVISTSLNSQKELNYIINNSPLEYSTDINSFFDSCEGFTKVKNNFYSDDDTNSFAFYLPFLELTLLDTIYKNYDNPTIITHPHLAESVAHCLRKPCTIYDFDLNQLSTSTYTPSGYKEGEIITPKTRKSPSHHRRITLTDTDDFYSDLKKLAKLNNTSMNSMAKRILSPAVKELLATKQEEIDKLKKNKIHMI